MTTSEVSQVGPAPPAARSRYAPGTWVYSSASILGLVLIWEVAAHLTEAVPGPLEAGRALLAIHAEGLLVPSINASLSRIGIGYVLAAALALPLGLIAGLSLVTRSIVSPVVEMLRPISAIAWIPAAILWFGVTESAAYFLIWYGCFFPILLNTIAGASRVPRQYMDAAKNLGASKRMVFLEIVLPAASPSIIAGLRIGLGLGIAVIVAAELGIGFTLGSGLGYLLLNYSIITYAPERILAVIIVIGILGLSVDRGLAVAERRLIRWRS